ncbi:DMT family transporter [Qingshengfaniella alkalisoli]|nr:DMT family transporter [Qingshengfaniella alkalisoli]
MSKAFTNARVNQPLSAAGLILTAMALMGLIDNYVVIIAETTGLWQFQVIRSAMALCMLMAVARWRGWRLRPRKWTPVIARTAIQSTALIIYFAALAIMPISQAVAGLFTAPLFVVLLSVVVYRHPLDLIRAVAVICGFVGVILVLRPETGGSDWFSILPILAGLFYALTAVATREWCSDENALTLLFGFFTGMGLYGVIGLGVLSTFPVIAPEGAAGFSFRMWGVMSGEAWLWTFAQAVGSLIAVGCITRAYQLGEASYVTVFEYALLVFAVFWGWALFGDRIDTLGALGIVVIILSGTVITLRGSPDQKE